LALTISEALRATKTFTPEPDRREAAPASITAESVWEMLKIATAHLKAEIEQLRAELTAVRQELHSGSADDREEFDRVVQSVAAHVKGQVEKLGAVTSTEWRQPENPARTPKANRQAPQCRQ
jgi:ribosomal protein L29